MDPEVEPGLVVSPWGLLVVVGLAVAVVIFGCLVTCMVVGSSLPAVHAHRVGRSPPTWPSLASDTGALPVLRFSRHRLSPASSTTHTSHAGVDVHRAAHASHPPAAGDLAMVLPR